jgi:hypothetical protein
MTRRPQLPILMLLAAALFLRALVPAGWMPAPGGGSFAIQPCPAADFAPPDRGASHHHRSSHGDHSGDCAFAPLHAGAAPLHQPPLIEAPAPTTAKPLDRILIAAFPTGPPAPPPPSTGPPSIA